MGQSQTETATCRHWTETVQTLGQSSHTHTQPHPAVNTNGSQGNGTFVDVVYDDRGAPLDVESEAGLGGEERHKLRGGALDQQVEGAWGPLRQGPLGGHGRGNLDPWGMRSLRGKRCPRVRRRRVSGQWKAVWHRGPLGGGTERGEVFQFR